MLTHLLDSIMITPSLGDLLPLDILAALHETICGCCSDLQGALKVWWATPQEMLERSLGLCLVVGAFCHGEAADLG